MKMVLCVCDLFTSSNYNNYYQLTLSYKLSLARISTHVFFFIFRYSPNEQPRQPTCNHEKKLQCKTLTLIDLQKFHAAFYKTKDKLTQDSIILKCCNGKPVQRRKLNNTTRKGREFTLLNIITREK